MKCRRLSDAQGPTTMACIKKDALVQSQDKHSGKNVANKLWSPYCMGVESSGQSTNLLQAMHHESRVIT